MKPSINIHISEHGIMIDIYGSDYYRFGFAIHEGELEKNNKTIDILNLLKVKIENAIESIIDIMEEKEK